MSHLNTVDIIRAWKDREYRLSLSERERALLPQHPAGPIELMDAETYAIAGGYPPFAMAVSPLQLTWTESAWLDGGTDWNAGTGTGSGGSHCTAWCP